MIWSPSAHLDSGWNQGVDETGYGIPGDLTVSEQNGLRRRHLKGRWRPVLVSLAASLTLFSACGPITAHQRIGEATVAVEAARAAQADRYAVYEYVSAVEFLKKAREVEGFSEFQDAVDLAATAEEYAEKARKRALASPDRGLLKPGETVPAAETPGKKPDPAVPPEGSQL